jgi:hypothetical protein
VAAINPDATAVVGALTDQVPFQENLVPYLWRLGEGFTLLGELGRPEDYDLSTALDVSDDGERVVGVIQARAVSNGDPPPIGFLWTRETGTQSLGALLEASGGGAHDIWYTRAISGDGRRILVTGIERPTIHDTTSAILELDLIPR